MLDELGLEHGDVRVDVAVIGAELHGYELKSERDSLERLPRQVRAYSAALDRATLVVAERHLRKASVLVPPWWGLVVASGGPRGLWLVDERPAAPNPEQQSIALARLLWRDEVLAFLAELHADKGVRSKHREALYQRLLEAASREQIRERVLRTLPARPVWRPALRPAHAPAEAYSNEKVKDH